MDKQLTLGSLFDGSGGFPLGGVLNGITPLWASEVEPFPIRVTTKRFPDMKHYGDISKIDGATVPPVDIITFGSPCTDMSVAGKRAGLDGQQSVLFYEAIRIIKEMRAATNGAKPRFILWENVPGAFSSNHGADFKAVLDAIIQVAEPTAEVPAPAQNKWAYADAIVGDGWSVAYRVVDAQHFGVAQRRRRVYLVADFAGERAADILFEREGVSRDFAPRFGARESTAGGAEDCARTTVAFEPGAASRLGGHVWNEFVGALRADPGDNQTAVVVENHPQDSRVKIRDDGIVQTLASNMGEGGGNVPMVLNERQYALTVGENMANTLTGTDCKGTQCVFEPKTLKIRSGCEGGGKGALVQDNLSATLATHNDQTLFYPRVFGICSQNSNSMRSANPDSGVYEMGTSRTLDTTAGASGNGGTVIVMEGNGQRPSHKGSGISEDIAPTINTVERSAVCYQEKVGALCAADYKFPQNQQIDENKAVVECVIVENYQHSGYREVATAGTLKASGGDFPGGENIAIENRYVVRRLAPQECALLQGFPSDWCAELGIPNPTEDEISFWTNVFAEYAAINGTKPRNRRQILKWLADPHSDSKEYAMWGNGIALPCAVFVLRGIAEAARV
jgi:DNA (cytosine-5)-methyltransferase 1